ncbi:MAG: hypothetical protein KDJ29_20635 [Hyphomicrobiales bacterium]|nr:hypothetical protein [Hyphomicrobiales bacterium]
MDQSGMAGSISPSSLFARLRDGVEEIAVLDVREEGRFGDGHILVASALPLSRLELEIHRLAPRKTVFVVVYDDNDGVAPRACEKLAQLGYANTAELHGGLPAWVGAGYAIYDGLNTPSKALGVFAHRELGIPEIMPGALAAMLDSGRQVAVLDCRPFSEYQNGCIPGASSCPGAMLAANAAHAADGADAVVINCAGRTRGLAGAQTLRDFGYSGSVLALRDGAMGWQLSGRAVEKNAGRSALPAVKVAPGSAVLEKAADIRAIAGIKVLDAGGLAHARDDASRTAYLFDIREKDEYDAGHIAGARHVPGGQLVQNLDMHVAVRGSRIVVCDRDGVSATGIALWLKRMGWRDVFIARLGDGRHDIVVQQTAEDGGDNAKGISPAALKTLIDGGRATVVDLASSREYRKGHVPGSWFVVRSRLAAMIGKLPVAEQLVFTSEDGRLAALAAQDELSFPGEIRALTGGTAAWISAGFALANDVDRLIDVPDDVVLKPSELPEGPDRDEAMRIYLGGSEELLEKVEQEGLLRLDAIPVT